jgi:hypothetical protein
MYSNLDLRPLIWFSGVVVLILWGLWELIDYLFIDEVIKSSKPIIPDIEITIKNSVSDTTYIYRKP